MALYNNILETIGNTPLVKLQKLAPPGVNVFVKVESFNPMGSIKDRMAREIIESAELSGELKPGQTVIEATSGNTGIGLAMVCAQKDYPLVVVMAENFSVERRRLLRFLGAKVVLTPAAMKGSGMLIKAEELAKTHGYYYCRQFENEANAKAHSETTAQEIIQDFANDKLHYWVSGFGTGGTLKGVSRALKQANPETRVVVAEPDNSQLLGSGITQDYHPDGTPSASHPNFRPHLVQGWSPDFISRLTEEAVSEKLVDQVIPVGGVKSLQLARDLARREGIFVGISSGATLAAALELANHCPQGTNIVCMLPDTGERYLSTPLFEDISEDMNESELELSCSTQHCQFESKSVTALVVKDEDTVVSDFKTKSEELDVDAKEFVNSVINEKKVVLFALEWCEFCWSARKFFSQLGIEYQSIDLDCVAYQKNNRGGKIREVLTDRLGVSTIPQIFVGSVPVGGSTDLFQAYDDGSLQKLLDENDIRYNKDLVINPSSLLPAWLHPRKSA